MTRLSVRQLTEYRERIRDALGRPDSETERAWWLRKRKTLDNRSPWDVWSSVLMGHLEPAQQHKELDRLVEVARG